MDRCGQRSQLEDKPCRKQGIIDVPTGYGRSDKMCLDHAREWADSHLRRFKREVEFRKLLKTL